MIEPERSDPKVPAEFVKASNLLNLLKSVSRSEHNHPFMASLYAPLAIGDYIEGKRQRSEGGRGLVPMLGALALTSMAAPHLADPLARYMEKQKLRGAKDLASHAMQRLTSGLGRGGKR